MPAQTTAARGPALRLWATLTAATLFAALLWAGTATPQPALAAISAQGQIVGGDSSSCTLENGQAYCWGWNASGQLGNGGDQDSSVPVAVDTSGVLAGRTLVQITTSWDGTT